MKILVYDKTGKKASTLVETKLFDGKENPALVAEAVYVFSARQRQVPASTLDRSEVRGGGRKPWRQKGTGRARAGSNRSPIWRSGGVTFGPRPERHYKLNIPKKKAGVALKAALATKKAEDILVIKEMKLEKPNTKAISDLFKKLDLTKNILVISEVDDINLYKSVRNLKIGVKTYNYKNLNVYDVLWAKKLVFLGESLKLAGGKK